jgi:hypothetical protein
VRPIEQTSAEIRSHLMKELIDQITEML